MQFNLFLSNTYEDAFLKVLENLKQKQLEEKRHFFVVPDRITLSTEKHIFEKLNIKSTFNIEVITLSKLANKLLNKKLFNKKLLTKESGMLLVTKIILENKDKLKAFKKATHFLGFIENIFETIMQLKSSNVSPCEFLNSAKNQNVSLKLKMEDIAFIYKEYEENLKGEFIDANSKLNMLIDEVKSVKLTDFNFYFALFDAFTPKQYELIEALVTSAHSVSVGIVSNTKQNNAHIYPTDLYENLTNIARVNSINIKDAIINTSAKLGSEYEHILKNFYGYKKPSYLLKTEKINLLEAKEPTFEVEFVASNILKLVQTNNLRFNEIKLAVSNIEGYAPIIKEVFEKRNIPFYLDVNKPLYEHSFILFVVDAFKTVKSGFLNDNILTFSKNYYSVLTNEEKHLFEDEVLKYNINYKQFLSNLTDDFYDSNLESVRVKILSLLTPLLKMEKEDTVKNYVSAIKEFLEGANALEKQQNLNKIYELNHNLIEQKRLNQVYDKLNTVLDNLLLMLGDNKIELNNFYELFIASLKAINLATIPVSADCVTVFDSSNNNFIKSKALFVLGATAGSFPMQKLDVGILLDEELNRINKTLAITPTIKELNKRARFNAFQLLTTASDKLFISYSRLNIKGEPTQPSEIIYEMQKLFLVEFAEKKLLLPIKTFEEYFMERFNTLTDSNLLLYYYANPKVATEKLIKEVKTSYLEKTLFKPYLNSVYNLLNDYNLTSSVKEYISYFTPKSGEFKITNAKKLFFKSDKTKVSQLEAYFACPFRHFLQYGLKLQEKERAGVSPIDVGNILHKVVEEFGYLLKEDKVKEENLKQIALNLIEKELAKKEYAFLSKKAEYKNILKGLKKEAYKTVKAIYDEQQSSSFKLSNLEYKVGFSDDKSFTINTSSRKFTFRGIVDRIDSYKDYFRIIDYKTGSADFSFKELYYGKKIQLFTYAFIIEEQSKKKIAGVFYLPIKNNFIDENKAQSSPLYKMKGAMLEDVAIIKAFDKNLSAVKPKSSFVHITLKVGKTGDIEGLSYYSKKLAFNGKELIKIKNYLKSLIALAIDEILKGNITPTALVESNINTYNPCEINGKSLVLPTIKTVERKMLSKVTKQTLTKEKL